ncbi:uncharacterized protein LOC129582775 [Paramacrobiotus metropolitanus]|uniref:uncharacterized protein LOC129582775 n=1 Tax=Paramacrobiotus metropolitanus TaxID=2943436 RepID=UPI0024457502|nr:uncharacterized protein LOC129582775 [Paramacrobiotus metropolitanus]
MMTFAVCLILSALGGTLAASLVKLPLSPSEMCDKNTTMTGKTCSPDVCTVANCSIIPDAICVADKCGCRARFFHFTAKENVFAEVTHLCKAAHEIKVAGHFMMKVIANDETAVNTVAKNPEVLLKVFKGLNILTADVLRVIAAFLKNEIKEHPTEATLQRYQTAIEQLKALEKHKDKKISNDEISEDAEVSDEVLEERHGKIKEWINKFDQGNTNEKPITDTAKAVSSGSNDESSGSNDESDDELMERAKGKPQPAPAQKTSKTDKVNAAANVAQTAADIHEKVKGQQDHTVFVDDEMVERINLKNIVKGVGTVADLVGSFLDEEPVMLMDEQTGAAISVPFSALDFGADYEDMSERKVDWKKVVGGVGQAAQVIGQFLDEDVLFVIRDGSRTGAMGLDLFNKIWRPTTTDTDSGTMQDEGTGFDNDEYMMDLEIADGVANLSL